MFITFEGLDASGKSTQVERVAEGFKSTGDKVLILREPGGTAVGERIRAILLDIKNTIDPVSELLLFSAARAQLVREVIRPALQQGIIVLSDRYVDSTIAYQGYGRQLPPESVHAISRVAIDGLLPDLTFFIDVSLETIRKRQQSAGKVTDRMERAGEDFFDRARNGFIEISQTEKRLILVDGERTPDEIFNDIWSTIVSYNKRLSGNLKN
jgi:dTMP kinase